MSCAELQRLTTTKQQATGYVPQAYGRKGSFHQIVTQSIVSKYTHTKLSSSTTNFSRITFAQIDKVVQAEVAPESLGFLFTFAMYERKLVLERMMDCRQLMMLTKQ